MNSMKIKRIFVEKALEGEKRAEEIINTFSPKEVFVVSDIRQANAYFEDFPDPLKEGKQSLYLGYFKGRFFEPCPCTKEYFRCGYWILSPAVGCVFDCSYCILQAYLNAYPIQIYLNLDKLFDELRDWEENHQAVSLRLGTGELADSLMLEPKLGIAQPLIEFFRERKNFIFELKTKSNEIDFLKELEPAENIIISWSLNPPPYDEVEEKGTARVEERIACASELAELGWLVGFHFDPIIINIGLERYLDLIDALFEKVPAERVAWISIGALRFPAKLKTIITERHPESKILLGEMIVGRDKKFRYPRPIRERFFKQMISRIQSHSRRVLIYLCMEDRLMWERLFGISADIIKSELATLPSQRKHFKLE